MIHDVKKNQDVSEIVENYTDGLEKVETHETSSKRAEVAVIDFGDFTGTATIEGTLDVRKFIDIAMELPTLKKKYGGRKVKPPTKSIGD